MSYEMVSLIFHCISIVASISIAFILFKILKFASKIEIDLDVNVRPLLNEVNQDIILFDRRLEKTELLTVDRFDEIHKLLNETLQKIDRISQKQEEILRHIGCLRNDYLCLDTDLHAAEERLMQLEWKQQSTQTPVPLVQQEKVHPPLFRRVRTRRGN